MAFKIADPDDYTPVKNSEAPQGTAILHNMTSLV